MEGIVEREGSGKRGVREEVRSEKRERFQPFGEV
jgi:hypothetical protein